MMGRLRHAVALAQHGIRDSMAPWLAVSLTLHAGLIAAVLPDHVREENWPEAGGAIAVDLVLVEGPAERASTATGETNKDAQRADRARMAERRTMPPAPPPPVPDENTEPIAEPVEVMPQPPAPKRIVSAKAPPETAAPVILAPRPRRKPAPPRPPAARPDPATPPERTAGASASEHKDEAADLAALPPAGASPGGGSRGASPQPGNPKPVYPDSARRQGRQGRAILRVEVRSDGTAGAVSIDTSSGDFRLDEAALAAVRQWRFRPALRNGAPVAVIVRVPIRFRLR